MQVGKLKSFIALVSTQVSEGRILSNPIGRKNELQQPLTHKMQLIYHIATGVALRMQLSV